MEDERISPAQVLRILREMQKWGFSLIQARSSKQQPLADQISDASIVARQLLGVAEDAAGDGVDAVAQAMIDVSYRTSQDGAFVELERRWQVGCLHIPFLKDMDPEVAHDSAIEACNNRVKRDGLDVINVETIFERGFFGGLQPVGLMIWHRI